MNGTFNGQILVDKLSKLNSSQQSIETLSHWCIFHRKNAKQVVETWGRQFHCAPKTQWVSFLYLANDILQNSRRKGLEFVNEFWKVLPDALNNAVESGDEFGRSAALRLIDIWEDRKVFGSRGQALKDEIFGRKISSLSTKNSKTPIDNNIVLNDVGGGELQKLISSYQRVYEGPVDEPIVFDRCQLAIGSIDKVEKEIVGNPMLGDFNGSHILEDLEGQHIILRECVEELKMAEASRASLVSNLRGALQEQESKLERVRQRLQASQLRLEQVGSICQRLTAASNGQIPKETTIFSDPPPSFIQEADSLSVRGGGGNSGESRKAAAAAMAAKLTTSAASAEMLSYVLSSLASEGKDETSNDGKRPRLESNPPPPYVPQEPPLPPPPLPPPPLPPMPPPPQYLQVSSRAGAPHGYGAMPLQRPKGVQGFSMPSNASQPPPHFLGQTGTYQRFTQQPPLPVAPPPPPPPASRQ